MTYITTVSIDADNIEYATELKQTKAFSKLINTLIRDHRIKGGFLGPNEALLREILSGADIEAYLAEYASAHPKASKAELNIYRAHYFKELEKGPYRVNSNGNIFHKIRPKEEIPLEPKEESQGNEE